MNFEEFQKWTMKEIRHYLPNDYKNANIEINQFSKLNKTYTALLVTKSDERQSPAIDLDALYAMYQNGKNPDEILRTVRSILLQADKQFDYENILDYKKAKNRFFIRASNAESNKEVLLNAPHKIIGDLVITYHVAVDINDGGLASTMVTNGLLEQYGITPNQLHRDCMENGPRIFPVKVDSLNNIVFPGESMSDEIPSFYVVTNNVMMNGAAAVFYPGVLDKLSDQFGCDLYVIPSSIHEMMIVPDDGTYSNRALEKILRNANSAVVSSEEQLSNTLYHYDQHNSIFEQYSSFNERIDLDFKDSYEIDSLCPAEYQEISSGGLHFH